MIRTYSPTDDADRVMDIWLNGNRQTLDFYLREGLSVTAEGMDEDTGHAEYTLIWNHQGRRAPTPSD